ncbi:Slp family lipoprotein [Bowmanella sp. JS7-9]|uniref:Slp family lipoprotein n=1 Tax=Pseudobowmanella zhangzhouensis TaxID=1537679 RepID=A0ABW1XJG7_9ALTE|nr:Slp family lipoprotein [Bowmanella sp. JS7-9]
MLRHIVVSAVLLLLGACASVPDNLKVADDGQLIPYQVVVLNPADHVGKPARWGGVIAEIRNLKSATMIEIAHRELNSSGRPVGADFSAGRFRVYVSGFLDPVVFQTGRTITFVGQVGKVEEGQVGEQAYQFPTLMGQSYQLWSEQQQVDVSSIEFGFGIWPSAYHRYWSGWGHSHFGIYPSFRRVIVRDNNHRGTGGITTPATTAAPESPQVHPQQKPALRQEPVPESKKRRSAERM